MTMTGDDAYEWLTDGASSLGWDPFDIHVVASILALAMAETGEAGNLTETTGLSETELRSLVSTLFPGCAGRLTALAKGPRPTPEVEQQSVRDLLLLHTTGDSSLERPLAAMIARRAMEPDHLWQDLGLRDRGELSDLLYRHFGPLAQKNTENMKWKRFFYRMICEAEGFSLCTTPVCSDCTDFEMCFGEETGESRLARIRDNGPFEFSEARSAV